jgi:hypothetical protein
MPLVLRNHLAPHEAHIMAGSLRSAGVPAYVWGDQTAHLYGHLALGGCQVAVDEDSLAQAEEVLKAIPEDYLDDTVTSSTAETFDAGPPRTLDLLYFGLIASVGLAAAMTILALAYAFALGAVVRLDESLRGFVSMLAAGMVWSIIFAVGEGLLLGIVRGYRNGSMICRLLWIACALVTMAMVALTMN